MAVATRGAAPGFEKKPDYRMTVEPVGKTLRVKLAGEVIAESNAALVMHEGEYVPRYYLPVSDVTVSVLTETDRSTFCPFKGDARYWTVRVGDEVVENGAWAYDQPYDECASIAGRISFYNEKMEIELEA